MKKKLKNNDAKRWLCKMCNDKVTKRISIGTFDSKEGCTTDKRENALADVMCKSNNIKNQYADMPNLNIFLASKQNEAQTHANELPVDPIQEINDREYRKRNVIVFDVEERSNDVEADKKIVKQITNLACPHINIEELKINYRKS